MPKSLEKDQLLSFQIIKMMNLIRDENQRNQLFDSKISELLNPKYRLFVEKQLQVINNQQKGKAFPQIIFEDEDRKKVNLSKFKRKYIVIDF